MSTPYSTPHLRQLLCRLGPAGGGAWQTPFERVAAPGYERRADVAAATLTLQLPLEGKLARGGVVGVVKLADGRWLHAQAGGAQQDFYISMREVRAQCARCLPTALLGSWSVVPLFILSSTSAKVQGSSKLIICCMPQWHGPRPL